MQKTVLHSCYLVAWSILHINSYTESTANMRQTRHSQPASHYIIQGAAELMWNLNEWALTGKTPLNHSQASENST